METHTQLLRSQAFLERFRDGYKSIVNVLLLVLLAALNTSDTKAQMASRQNNGSANFLAFNTSFNNSSSLKDENPWKTIQQGVATIGGSQVHYTLEASPLAVASNIDQEANGKSQFTATTGSGTDWVNGNLNGSKSHYLEGYSIPYRMIITGLTINRTYIQKISWDITEAPGKHALDYITHYQNLDNPAGSHLLNFGHTQEIINPAFGIAGLTGPTEFLIPAPSSVGSPMAGQPTASFNALNKKNFTIYSGTITAITYDVEESLIGDHSISGASIKFVASGATVVLAWGGHIASQADWGFGHSASATNGSPYHMRNVTLCEPDNTAIPTPANSTFNNCGGGNQDRSLQTNSVIVPPDCLITGPTTSCPGVSKCFNATINAAGQTTTYAWTFAVNTAGASISSGATSGSLGVGETVVPQICVTTTQAGTYTLNLHITRVTSVGTLTHDCQYAVTVSPISITGDVIAGEADDDDDGIKPLTGTLDCPSLYEMNLLKTNVAHLTASGAATTYAWAFSPNTGANVSFVDNGDGTAIFTVNSTIALASEYKFIVTGTTADGCIAKDTVCIRPTSVLPLCNLCGPTIVCSTAGDKVYSLKDNCANANPDALDLADFTYTWSITNVLGGGSVAFVGANVDVATVTVHITGTVTSYTIQLNITGKGPLHINVPPCTITTSVGSISANAVPTSSTCGNSNGSVDLTVTGGTGPFTYLWNNGATTQDLTGVAAGAYNVTVTDANGCTAPASATVGNIGGPTADAVPHSATCGNSNGSVILTVTGGTAPYSYAWSNGATTKDLIDVPAGPYSVVVTDANGCTAPASATVGNIGGPTADAVPHSSTCGNSNGSVILTVTGGTAPYSYAWSNGATTKDLIDVPAGPYSVVVTDASGCTAPASATVGNIGGPTADAVPHSSTCGNSNGSVILTVTGGTAPYSYAWSNGATTKDLIDVPAGPYNVVVTDANGCTAPASATVGNIGGPTADAVPHSSTCGNSNGSVILTVTGGTAPYSYAWSNGATTKDLIDVPAGPYSVVVTDANGCTAPASATVGNIAGPTADAVPHSSTCGNSNGSVILTVTGGTAPYSYAWSNGATTKDLIDVPAGPYSVVVTDANGCTAPASATVGNIAGPTADAVPHSTTCGNSNGSVILTVTGGTAPYSYAWSNGATTKDLIDVPAGPYSVVVTDANGCTAPASATVGGSGPITCNLPTPTIPGCSTTGNTITGSVSGGTAPYTCTASFDAAGVGWVVTNCTVSAAGVITVTYTAGVVATTVLTVSVTSGEGCTTTCTVTVTCNGGKSCTPGFWKNHPEVWDQQSDFVVNNMPGSLTSPVTPGGTFITTTSFYAYFNIPVSGNISSKATLTMLEATDLGGGNCKQLARHGVSALLGAAAFPTEYPYPSPITDFTSLYNAIRSALLSGNCNDLGNKLAAINNLDGPFCSALSQLPQARAITSNGLTTVTDVFVNASPNPYSNVVNFKFVSPESGQASLEIYDMVGRKLAQVYTGKMQANVAQTVTYQVPAIQKRVPIVYKLTVGTKTVVGKLLPAEGSNINYTP